MELHAQCDAATLSNHSINAFPQNNHVPAFVYKVLHLRIEVRKDAYHPAIDGATPTAHPPN